MKRSGKEKIRPRIVMTAADHERLSGLADAAHDHMPDVAGYLSEELERARVVTGEKSVAGTVRMGSEVSFRDERTGKIQRVTLVYPGEADIAQGRISVLTPIGAALIGLHAGQSISWTTRTGEIKQLTVLEVPEKQPA